MYGSEVGRSRYIHKSHNVSVLIYHLVCSAKYPRVIFEDRVDNLLKEISLELSKRYEIEFLEIGTDEDHVHFLIQSVPMYSPKKIVQTIKSLTARELFKQAPEVKKQLWGGELWGKGYFINTVAQHGSEKTIANYVKNQGVESEYKVLHKAKQLVFEF